MTQLNLAFESKIWSFVTAKSRLKIEDWIIKASFASSSTKNMRGKAVPFLYRVMEALATVVGSHPSAVQHTSVLCQEMSGRYYEVPGSTGIP